MRTRDHFEAEIRAVLAEAFDGDTIQAVLDRLISRGVVDDLRLVRTLIEANRSKRAVSVETLRRRCAERGASEGALAGFADTAEPPLDALVSRFEHTDQGRARAYRLLVSRGFGEEEITSVLARFAPDQAEESA